MSDNVTVCNCDGDGLFTIILLAVLLSYSCNAEEQREQALAQQKQNGQFLQQIVEQQQKTQRLLVKQARSER